jgi:hypothetical protein
VFPNFPENTGFVVEDIKCLKWLTSISLQKRFPKVGMHSILRQPRRKTDDDKYINYVCLESIAKRHQEKCKRDSDLHVF